MPVSWGFGRCSHSGVCSLGSVALTLALNEPDWNAGGKLKSTTTQTESLQSTGPTCDDIATSIPSLKRTLPIGESIAWSEVFRAKTFPMRAGEPVLLANEADCSTKQCESFANWSQDSLCWRTWQRCLLEGFQTFSGRWPRSGLMRNGIAYRLPPLVRRISGTGSLSLDTEPEWWGTPNSHPRTHTPRDVDHGIQLANQVDVGETGCEQ